MCIERLRGVFSQQRELALLNSHSTYFCASGTRAQQDARWAAGEEASAHGQPGRSVLRPCRSALRLESTHAQQPGLWGTMRVTTTVSGMQACRLTVHYRYKISFIRRCTFYTNFSPVGGHVPSNQLSFNLSLLCEWWPTRLRDLQQTPGSRSSGATLWCRVDQHGHSSACQKTRVPVAALQGKKKKRKEKLTTGWPASILSFRFDFKEMFAFFLWQTCPRTMSISACRISCRTAELLSSSHTREATSLDNSWNVCKHTWKGKGQDEVGG